MQVKVTLLGRMLSNKINSVIDSSQKCKILPMHNNYGTLHRAIKDETVA